LTGVAKPVSPTPPAQASDLWLVPTPRTVRLTGAVHRLPSRLTYQGPDPATAFRLLHGACAPWRITILPGTPPADVQRFATVDVRAPADRLHPQGYRLLIDEKSIVIEAGPGEGLRHALVTLAQLIRRFGRDLQGVTIEDEPLFAFRGAMLDVSRDKVPTMASLFATVDALESFKVNHLQLYTEHTFAYSGHEEAWAGCSPITPEEARELDDYCSRRGIDLAANQNTLGHLARWLRLPRYNDLAEIVGLDTEWSFGLPDGRRIARRGPFSLCPTDAGSIDFVRALLDQLLPCFGSRLVNIGCDEAYDIGQGRSRSAVSERGYEAVYLDHLRSVADIARDHRKRAMFWADMLAKGNESSQRADAPEGAIGLVWGYEAKSGFRAQVERLRARGVESCWVCPGTSSWRSIVGRAPVRRANLDEAATCADASPGMLVTDWGDMGHRQHWPVSMIGLADGAARAWSGAGKGADARGVALHAFADATGALGQLVDDLGSIDAELNDSLALRNAGALFTELSRSIADPPGSGLGSLDEWQRVRNGLAALRERFEALPDGAGSRLVRDEVDHTLSVAEHAADKAIVCRVEPARPARGAALIRLAADMGAIIEDHRSLWLARNREGGLNESTAHYERVLEDYG